MDLAAAAAAAAAAAVAVIGVVELLATVVVVVVVEALAGQIMRCHCCGNWPTSIFCLMDSSSLLSIKKPFHEFAYISLAQR